MTTPCAQRETILAINSELKDLHKDVSAQKAIVMFSHDQIVDIFESLKEIRTYVDKNQVAAGHRDEKLEEIIDMMKKTHRDLEAVTKEAGEYRTRMEKSVDKVQSTVENGLNKRVTEVKEELALMKLCMEKRREEFAEKKRQEELAKEKEEAEFGIWKKAGRAIARNVNWIVEKNILILLFLLTFFIFWLNFGGDGMIIEHIKTSLRNLLG